MKRSYLAYSAALTVAALAGTVCAQPVFIATDAADDIDATGMRTVGRLIEWSGLNYAYIPYIWTHGQGMTRVPSPNATPAVLVGSGDLNALAMGLPNYSNWGALNCFNGYCQSWSGCPEGTPVPPLDPCGMPEITSHYTPGTGWLNAGSLARELDPQSGRFYGGTHCGSDINLPADISSNGRYVVGNAWWSPLTNSEGGPAMGLCGEYRGFIYDSATQSIAALPVAGGKFGKAQHVNADGSVVTGTSPVEVVDGEWSYLADAGTVWVNGVATVLDTRGSGSGQFAVNGAGTVVVGGPSDAFVQTDLGLQGAALVRWTRQANGTWLPESLGRTADRDGDACVAMAVSEISADGSTVIGVANYREVGFFGIRRPFIWRQSINGGVPMDLVDYITQIGPDSPFATGDIQIDYTLGLSADGNAILLRGLDWRNTCTNGGQSHVTGVSGVLYLDGTGIACEPSRIAITPTGWTETQDLTYYGSSLNVSALGTWPLNYQWQREDPQNPGQWIDLVQDCTNMPDPVWGGFTGFAPGFAYEGAKSRQLRIGSDPNFVCERAGALPRDRQQRLRQRDQRAGGLLNRARPLLAAAREHLPQHPRRGHLQRRQRDPQRRGRLPLGDRGSRQLEHLG